MKRALLAFSVLGAVFSFAGSAFADEIIVTANRGPQGIAADRYGGSATILSAEDLRTRQTRTVSDVLRDAPSVAVARTGGVGGQTQVRIRGAEGNHTLVLIDGIEVGDPFQGEFDFAGVIADEASRIEVLRGPQSALYGSDAIGGTIQILTLSGAEQPGASLRIEGGSFGSADAAGRAAGVFGPLDLAISGAYQDTDGIDISGSGGEKDGARTRSVSAKARFALAGDFALKAVGRYVANRAETDPGGPRDGAVDFYRQQGRYGLVGAEGALLGGRWTHDLSFQVADVERRTRSEPSAFSNGRFDTDGRREKLSYVTGFALTEGDLAQRLTFAFDDESETFQTVDEVGPVGSKRSTRNRGYVGQYRLDWRRLNLSAALRNDDNSRFRDAFTHRVEASFALTEQTRLRGAFGEGIKNPSNFELFGFNPTSFIGNPNLKPETSEGFEIGLEHRFSASTARFGVTYFEAELHDEIATRFLPGFVSTPVNLTTISPQRGVEATLSADLPAGFRLDASYAYLDATQSGREEIRRPPHSGSVNIAWRAGSDRIGAFLTARYQGDAQDDDFATFPATRVTLPNYVLVNLGGDVRLTQRMALFARVENAADEAYQDVVGYATPGRAGYVGVRAAF